MEEIKGITTKTYDAGNGFLVDIEVIENKAEAWIYHERYGIKDLMFGTEIGSKHVPDYNAFVELVEANLEPNIDGYKIARFDENFS